MKRLLVTFMALCMVMSSLSLSAFAAQDDKSTVAGASFNEAESTTPIDYTEYMSYQDYAEKHKNDPKGSSEITLGPSNISSKTAGVKFVTNYKGRAGSSIYTTETDSIEFKFNVKAGLYNLYIEYYTEPGKNVSIERAVYVNGEIPFNSAEDVNFTRIWKDNVDRDENGNLKFSKDVYGNGIVPDQVEVSQWTSSYFYDNLGFYTSPLQFSFKDGVNTLKLEAVKEPMTIGCIKLVPAEETKSYEQYKAECNSKNYADYSGEEIFIQGESPTSKSDQTLYPNTDVSSASTSMADGKQNAYIQSINMIGGSNWQYTQQSITWTVPNNVKEGMYNINFKVRKNQYEGMISSRKLYVNGEIPYAECSGIKFKYSNNWTLVSPTTDDGEECLIHLKAGDTLTLEATLGDMGPILRLAEETMNNINEIYRSIIMITGSSPDTNRDYQLEKLIPDVLDDMVTESENLTNIVNSIVEFTGQKGSDMSSLETLARQLKTFKEEPDKISKQLSPFKTNISSYGTWMNNANYTPLELDYISLSAPGTEPAKATANFFTNFGYEFNRFISSFVVDYNAIGSLEKKKDDNKTITVWIASGRDQYQQLRALINNSYTASTGNQVNLELVNVGALLSAVVAKIGPDVVLGQAKNEPVNYALRNAIYSLSNFDDLDEITKRFSKEALVPFYFNNGKTTDLYALPETQDFYMLFYRKDVLAELGLGIPNTWDQLIQCITVLNKNNMEFGMPQTLQMFYTLLIQNEGSMYTEDYKSTNLKSTNATKAFKLWTNFFVNYDCPKTYDFKNRFRTGEMPLGVDTYTLYNTLAVSAPEIRGLWGFTSVPGVVGSNGKINRGDSLVDTNCFILKDNISYDLSWEFLKWWTSAETQSSYGNRLECVLGSSARYNTANVEAFQKLPWTSEEISAMNKQLETCESMPEVAGSYFINRHILNAFRKVIYNDKDARDTLYDYSNVIDSEITSKRAEFGLPTVNDK